MSKAQTIKTLKAIGLFATLTQRELGLVADLTAVRTYEDGERVVREGDVGEEMFVIVEGMARVTRGRRRIVDLGPGDYFGEMSLITKGLRSASIHADGPLSVLVIGRWSFAALTEKMPSIGRRLLETMAERVRQLDDSALH